MEVRLGLLSTQNPERTLIVILIQNYHFTCDFYSLFTNENGCSNRLCCAGGTRTETAFARQQSSSTSVPNRLRLSGLDDCVAIRLLA